jgi:hypothetical protein
VYDFPTELLLALAFPLLLRDALMEQLLRLRGSFRLTPRVQIVQIISILLCGIACSVVRAKWWPCGRGRSFLASDRGQLREAKHAARLDHAAWRLWNLDEFQACRLLNWRTWEASDP